MNYQFRAVVESAVDRKSGIITGVSVITSGVVRGHGVMADEQTLMDVMNRIVEFGSRGVKVKADHWSGFDKIVGVLKDPRVEGDKCVADLHLMLSHPMFNQIVELADRMPGSFGLSIAFSGEIEEKEKLPYVRVTELYSVDLVDEPAANPTGLFSVDMDEKGEDMTMSDIKTAVLEALGVKKAVDETAAELETARCDRDALSSKLDESISAVTRLTKERDELQALQASAAKLTETLTAELAAAKTAVTEFDAKVEALASVKALQITQQQGQAPLSQTPVQDPASNKGDLSHLKGLERVKAAIELELSRKK